MEKYLRSLPSTLRPVAMTLVRNLTSDPRVRTVGVPLAIGLAGLQTLRVFNRWLSQRALNHYVSNSRWDWDREVVVVTGGLSGLGVAIVKILAERGVEVVILDVKAPEETLPPRVHAYQVDITSPSAVSSTASLIRSTHGDPTVLINNAGLGSDQSILPPTSVADIRRIFEVNLFAHILLVREFLPAMIARDHGHIVTVASMASYMTRAANVDYSASKAAVMAFHEGLGVELATYYGAKRVRTSIVHPIWIKTPMMEPLIATGKFSQPFLQPEDVARPIVDQLYSGNSGQLIVPTYMTVFTNSRGWPHWIQEWLRLWLTNGVKDALIQANKEREKEERERGASLGKREQTEP